jgi:hypothetical protein
VENRWRCRVQSVGLGTGPARGRGAGLARQETVPQEFVALVHVLLGCQAINSIQY